MDSREILNFRVGPLWGPRVRIINRRVAGTGVSWPIYSRSMFFDDGTQAFWALQGVCSTGYVSVGQVVSLSQASPGQWEVTPIAGNLREMPAGIVVANQFSPQWTWIAYSGLVYALPEAAVTATAGYVAYTSVTTAGYLQQAAAVPPAGADHFSECGHWAQNGSGPGAAALLLLHWN